MKSLIVSALVSVSIFSFVTLSFANSPFGRDERGQSVMRALDDFEEGHGQAVEYVSASSEETGRSKDVSFTIKPKKKLSVEMGYEMYSYVYKEKVDGDHFMDLKGVFKGVFTNLAYRPEKNVDPLADWADVYRLESRIAWASLDYNGGAGGYSIQTEGTPDMVFEVRGLMGPEYSFTGFNVAPYGGLGWRYLRDDSSDQGGTLPNGQTWSGYKRVSHYAYIPLGLNVETESSTGWGVKLNLEYDLFVLGRQKSYTPVTILYEDETYQYDSISNQQGKGYGLRSSLRLSKDMKHVGFFVEPFVRFWDIGDSDLARFEGPPGYEFVGVAMEPNNKTQELGVNLGMKF